MKYSPAYGAMRGSACTASAIRSEVSGAARSMSSPCQRRSIPPSMAMWSVTHGLMFSSHHVSKAPATVIGSAPSSRSRSNASICMQAMATPRPRVGVVVATASPTVTRPGASVWLR